MARDVQVVVAPLHHRRALGRNRVEHAHHARLIARDDLGAVQDQVVRQQLELVGGLAGGERERRTRLGLRPGRHDEDLVGA